MRKIGRIVMKFLYSLSLCSSVSWLNVLINLFVVFLFREKMKKDYYLTFDSFDFRSICTNDGKRLKTNRG